jgi:hypothetical protein
MAHVFVHTRSQGKMNWTNQPRDFTRVPVVGEYFALDVSSPWYLVQLVVHVPFKAEYEAEVFAVEVHQVTEMKKAWGDTSP